MKNQYRHFALVFRWILVVLTLCGLSEILKYQDHSDTRYLTPSTIQFEWKSDVADTSEIIDTVTGESIYRVTSKEGYPLYFYQVVADDVCFDNKCRPINLQIYWNITGRYFGFMLEDGEFLSRRDHEPFDTADYLRLHHLLADPMLPFANVRFEELVDSSETSDSSQVDGLTGATSRQLSAYVVEGAAYTTYVLWSALYGSAKALVEQATRSQLNKDLLLKILESPSSIDHIWGLKKIDALEKIDLSIEERILMLIGGEDFFVSYTAINWISPVHLQSFTLQDGLFDVYSKSQSNIRKPILDKLYGAPQLSPKVLLKSYELLPGLNGNELGQWLKLYMVHSITDQTTCWAVVKILQSENRFIANKAYQFLADLENMDPEIKEAIRSYKEKN